MVDSSYPVFPIFALLSFFVVLIPLPWHLQALNSGTCLFMVWTAIGCLNQFINSIVWHANFVDRAPLWCDISTRITVGVGVAIPAASLCINRRLYKIATCNTATITHAQKKRAIAVDLCIGLGIPALQMILQFIVQGHRYDLWEDIGCLPTTVNTPPAYPLTFLWPNIISLVSAVYCILTLKAFMRRRAQFSQFLSSTTSLSIDRYFRLMCLATMEIIFTVPISSYGLYLNIVSKPIYVWKSWSDTHFDFFVIDVFPAALWRTSKIVTITLELERWLLVVCAIIFFAFFGFADEARKNYRRAYWAVASRFGASKPSATRSQQLKGLVLPKGNPTDSLPVFNDNKSPISISKRDSFFSVTSRESGQITDYTDTLQGTPVKPEMKFHRDFSTYSPSDSSRMSCVTI